jgi:hypothetical protein
MGTLWLWNRWFAYYASYWGYSTNNWHSDYAPWPITTQHVVIYCGLK